MKRKKYYVYFVSYKFPNGFGRCEIERDKKITHIDDIASMEGSLRLHNDIEGISIENYILLRIEWKQK